jgi:hypothetical protein
MDAYMYNNNLNDSIIDFLRNNPNGVSSLTIAELLLKLKHPDKRIAHTAVRAILNNDNRCTYREKGGWYFIETGDKKTKKKLCDLPWVSVYILSDSSQINNQLLYVSVFSVFEIPQCLFSQWIYLPDSISYNKSQLLISKYDSFAQNKNESISYLSNLLNSKNIIFFSFYQQTILENEFLSSGEAISDNTLLASQLIYLCGIETQKQVELPFLAKTVLGKQNIDEKPYTFSAVFAKCMNELFFKLFDKGITTSEDFDKECQKHMNYKLWKSSLFSKKGIYSIPEHRGVYGFKNENNEFIYIGKAANLRKRFISFFQHGVGLTGVILELRKQAVDYTVHYCGSELECLLYEYRLIKKYNPILNPKLRYNVSFDNLTPLPDCIILLPHYEKEKGMSFWIREDQELVMKSFFIDSRDDAILLNQLENFYFLRKKSVKNSDIIEIQLAKKWITRKESLITHISVYQMTSAKETLHLIRKNWRNNTG